MKKNKPRTLGLGGVLLATIAIAGSVAMATTGNAATTSRPPQQTAPEITAQGLLPDGEMGWLGLAVQEVTPAEAKESKLPAAYGAAVAQVADNSPAAKAGLKKDDVITEYNGQRVEGTAEFRRLVRETPPGHLAQLSVWRDGHMEKLSAEVGHAPDQEANNFFGRGPAPPVRDFGVRPEPPLLPGAMYGRRGPADTPTLGVAAMDLSGQLGQYFGAPDGEGVLVAEVRKDSPGEKAGLKAGDVIIKANGQRIHNLGELREVLREGKSVALGVLRNGMETSMTAEPDKPQSQSLDPRRGMDRRIPL